MNIVPAGTDTNLVPAAFNLVALDPVDVESQLSLFTDDELDAVIDVTENAALVNRLARIERGRRTDDLRGKSLPPGSSHSQTEWNRRSEERTVAAWYDTNHQPLSTVKDNGWKKLVGIVRTWRKLLEAGNKPDAPALPIGIYTTIEADPPWHIPSGDKGPGYQYPMMDTDDIATIADQFTTTDNAHLYLWATNTHIDDALTICQAWGFTYRTVITWVKPRIGLGHHFRTSTEHIIFGVKGKLDTLVNDQRTHFEAPAGRHSQKPSQAYELIERCSPGPYLRLFARDQRDGWTSWGNEA